MLDYVQIIGDSKDFCHTVIPFQHDWMDAAHHQLSRQSADPTKWFTVNVCSDCYARLRKIVDLRSAPARAALLEHVRSVLNSSVIVRIVMEFV